MKRSLIFFIAIFLIGTSAFSQTTQVSGFKRDIITQTNWPQEHCIIIMAGFPNASQSARYQFFRLTQKLAEDATPEFNATIAEYSSGQVTSETPVAKVLAGIVNPVLRQAEPRLVIGQAAYLITFAQMCAISINGQINSLQAYDSDLKNTEYNIAITQDALFLRQILSDALYSEGAHQDRVHANAVELYTAALISTRDQLEFTSYSAEIDDLEALYMGDLDKRLARSNDIANSEMDKETLSNAIVLSDDMSDSHKKLEKQRSLQTLITLLNGF